MKQWNHLLLHWLDKHPVGWFIAIVVLIFLFRKAWKIFLGSGHARDENGNLKDPNEIGPLAGCMLLIVCLGALAWLLNWHEPKATKATKAAPIPTPTRTTVVQHVTQNITKAAPLITGNLVWIILGVGLLLLIAFLNRRRAN